MLKLEHFYQITNDLADWFFAQGVEATSFDEACEIKDIADDPTRAIEPITLDRIFMASGAI